MTITGLIIKRARAGAPSRHSTSTGSVSCRVAGAFMGALMVCGSSSAVAGDWRLTPRLTIGETYTDNVKLVEDGERGDFITTISPGVSLRGTGPRINSSVDYNLRQLFYGHTTEFDVTNHQLQSNIDAMLVKDWLYVASASRISQQAIDNRRQIARNDRGPDGNRRDVISNEVRPSLSHSFGSWFNLDASYSTQMVDQGTGNNVPSSVSGNSSDESSYQVRVSSGRRFARTPMSLSYSTRTVDYDNGNSNKLERLNAEASYVFNRKFRLTASGGDESNDFRTNRRRSGGLNWSLGGTWTPSLRTSLSGNWGQRSFGKSFNISGRHTHRRLRVTGSYSEELRTVNEFERELVLVPLLDDAGEPVFDVLTSSQIFVPLDTPTLTDQVFLNKQARAGFNYALRRGNLGLSFYQMDRQVQSGFDEKTHGATVNFSRRLSPRLSFQFATSWRENTRSDEGQSSTYYSIYPSLSYTLGPHTSARLTYEHTRNDGGSFGGSLFNGEGYTENALSANLVFHL